MTNTTLKYLVAIQKELKKLITFARTTPVTAIIKLPETVIELQEGERYAGTVLYVIGQVKHHLVLMAPRHENRCNWSDAMAWAQEVGGSLPDRQEQALLFANCRPFLKPAWYWSCQEYESDASCAWRCYFGNGYNSARRKNALGAAVAVRRIEIEV